ncbi:MAG: hypothetical protein F6K30_18160 [Cyanothece sp. SIO2G6]|nr:hypothetical protein [Cyanothece sp. SIO2G6]
MPKRSRTELDGYPFPAPDNFYESRRLVAKRENLALPSLVMLGTIAIAWFMIAGVSAPGSVQNMLGLREPPTNSMSEAFRLAVNKAMLAAELTQTAEYREEWQKVAILWTEAVDLMRLVPDDSAQYAIAQAKVTEYGRNLKYAESNVQSRPTGAPISQQLWGKGATREFLLAVQGLPTGMQRNDTLCKETYYYGDSQVELESGIVSYYKNRDNNLNAVPLADAASPRNLPVHNLSAHNLSAHNLSAHNLPAPKNTSAWGLGATEQAILSLQGTPTRVKRYDSLEMDIFYYDSNMIQLQDGVVVGYSNFDGTLLTDMSAMVPGLGHGAVPSVSTMPPAPNVWSIGSARSDVFRVQGTPSQVTRNNVGCEETLHYEGSTVELRNGIVQEYNNSSNNLKVHLTDVTRSQSSFTLP